MSDLAKLVRSLPPQALIAIVGVLVGALVLYYGVRLGAELKTLPVAARDH